MSLQSSFPMTMKAVLFTKSGSTSFLQYDDIPDPVPTDDEILVQVKAASVNSWDWDRVHGKSFFIRMLKIFGQQHPVLGADIAGVVASVGKNVTKFSVGDMVFGDLSAGKWGGFAEYALASEKELAIMDPTLSFEEAAAIPQAGLLALQGLDMAPTLKDKEVLINGGGGGAGTFAIQLAKMYGATVTAGDKKEKFDVMRECGADHVIDVNKEDFSASDRKYDFVLDVMATRSPRQSKRALAKAGKYVILGGASSVVLQFMIMGHMISSLSDQSLGLLMHRPRVEDLNRMTDLVKSGKIKPVIDEVFPLRETAAAIQKLGDGRSKGKVIVVP